MEITRITADELNQRLNREEELIILDARNPDAWSQSTVKIPGAIRVNSEEIQQQAKTLTPNRAIIVYCT